MNLVDALKSGRRYRKVGSTDWHDHDLRYEFTVRQIRDDDYEIEEKKVEITREKLDKAVSELSKTYSSASCEFVSAFLAKAFGLGSEP